MMKRIALSAAVACAIAAAPVVAQQGMTSGEWHHYGGDLGSTKYSAVDQIDASNVKNLGVAWRWESPDNEIALTNRAKGVGAYKATPIMVGDTLYATTTYSTIVALDPATGKQKWKFDPKVWEEGRPGNLGFNTRGLSYWSDGKGDNRIIFATNRAYMYCLNADTGELIAGFGDGGVVDVVESYRRPTPRRAIFNVSPPLVVGDIIVLGTAMNDGPTTKEMPPGDVHAYDVRTGNDAWTFHNPPVEGEFGYDTWKEGSAEYTGNANVWTMMSADTNLGLVYLPFGTPTNDWYGGHRKGSGLFGESIVAVEAKTGKYKWHFQHVHHGLWDYDLPAAPALLDVTVDGKKIKALAQVTKQGFLWVLDRTNGEPVWPIEERAVPQSTVPGEESWPTQPFPTKPAPFTLQGSTEDVLIDYTPELKKEALEILQQFNHGPIYTPPTVDKPTIYNPGWAGGGNWTGLAADPDTGRVYIPSVSGSAISMTLTKPDAARSNFDFVGGVGRVQGPQGLPLIKGPYARINAIDLSSGDHAWVKPIGDGPINHPALKDLNLPPLGGQASVFVTLTKSLLFAFSSGSNERGHSAGGDDEDDGGSSNFFAIDKVTGDTIFEMGVEAKPSGTPMTYSYEGKQYIVVASGGGAMKAELIALALP